MVIIEKLTCSKCHETYKGVFRMNLNGDIECADCNDKVYFGDIDWKEITNAELDKELLHETYSTLLLEDVDTFYKIESAIGEDFTKEFYTQDGKINTDKLYFQNNPIDLVLEGNKLAHICLRYLDIEDEKKYTKYAKYVIETYKELRNHKLNDEEIKDVWAIFYSKEADEIRKVDG